MDNPQPSASHREKSFASIPNQGKKTSSVWLAKDYPPLLEGEHICYLLQFPGKTHKVYIGQTKNSLLHRVTNHISSANRAKPGGCAALKGAINQYGPESLLAIELCRVPSVEIDNVEQYYIGLYKSISPNGYNLETGGTLHKELSESTKIKIAASKQPKVNNRYDPKSKDLPKYIFYMSGVNSILGYYVVGHPKQRGIKDYFNDPLFTAEDWLESAKEFIQWLEAGIVDRTPPGWPKDVYETKVGYYVEYKLPNGNNASRRFADKHRPKEDLFKEAVDYSNKIRIESMQFRDSMVVGESKDSSKIESDTKSKD